MFTVLNLINFDMNWADKIEVKKGDIGERYAKEFLERKGFIIYVPVTNGPHKIDYFAHSGSKKRVIAVDAKTKKRMARYCETGINTSTLIHYKEIMERHNMPVYLYFVDDFEECIYGQWLEKLGDGTERKNVTLWHLSKMEFIRELNKDEVEELRLYSQKDNYDYTDVQKYFIKL